MEMIAEGQKVKAVHDIEGGIRQCRKHRNGYGRS